MGTSAAVTNIDIVAKKSGDIYTVLEVPSDSSPNKIYRVDITNQRCSCPGWVFSKTRKPCKHLQRFGFLPAPEMKKAAPKADPDATNYDEVL